MTQMNDNLKKWFELLTPDQASHLKELVSSVYSNQETPVYPLKENVFKAFELTSPEDVKVVILGQDPYHTPGQAQGLSFSLPDDAPTQPSMRNILKELESDLGACRQSQDLTSWAEQGVLLLNASLTVKEGQPNSMAKDWEEVTEWFIEVINRLPQPVVFILWGKNAQSFIPKIDKEKDIISSAHPSPFSARRGFFGSKPFSKTNELLENYGLSPVDWIQ